MEYSNTFIEVLNKHAETDTPVCVKDVIERFMMDSMGSSSFGIELDTLHNKHEDFQELVKKSLRTSWRRLVAKSIDKKTLRLIGFRTDRHYFWDYFKRMVKEIIEYREKNNVVRNDLLQVLLHTKKRQLVDEKQNVRSVNNLKITLDVITTQCYAFFVGGYETSASLLSFLLLEVAMSPDIQTKLRADIRKNIQKHGGFTYEAFQEMTYLEMVLRGK